MTAGQWGNATLNSLRRHLPLSSRADGVELLDSGRLSPLEVEQNLADLARLNRLPGGTAASVTGVRRLLGTLRAARILDVGTGRGDIPLAFADRAWRSVGVDVNPEVLHVARRETARQPLIEIVEGDARSLPFDDGAFDVAHCSLLSHHLEPDEVVTSLRELSRVARHGVVVNDLTRGIWPFCATGATIMVFGRSRVTRSDGLLSARRAYTLDELDVLLAEAGLVTRWRSSRWVPRVVTAASKS
jgi:ubiquinone/menaquinone biosynthesis C-methylase UbiE